MFLDFNADIAARVLGNEIKIKNREEKSQPNNFKKKHQKIEDNKTRIGNVTNFDNVSKRLEENISIANKKIEKQETFMENFMREHVRNQNKPGSSMFVNPSEHPFIEEELAEHQATFNVLLLVDSNLKNLKPDILSNESICAKFYCPTLNDIDNLIENEDIRIQPTKIFVHCGTNHFHKNDRKIDKVEDKPKYLCHRFYREKRSISIRQFNT